MEKRHAYLDLFLRRWRPVRVSALLLCAAVMTGACSDDDDMGGGKSSSATANVTESNSNMPSSGTVIAQYAGTSAETGIDKLVDNNVYTSYQVGHNQFYVTFEADKSVLVNHYSIRVGDGGTEQYPGSWILSGSDDNSAWTTLDSQNGQKFTGQYGQNSYSFPNATSYSYYKLEVTGNGGSQHTQISEWTLEHKDISATPDEPHSVQLPEGNPNMPTGGTLTAQYSDYLDGEKVDNLADGNPATAFSSQHTAFYLLWEGTESAVVNSYTLTSADDPNNAPSAWTLSGSDDNSTWTELDTQSGQKFNIRKEEKDYTLTNQTPYKYYRLDIKANNGGNVTQISEWSLKHLDISATPDEPHSVQLPADNPNMPTGGTLTAQYSDYLDGEKVDNLADGNPATAFSSKHETFYLLWEGTESVTVRSYTLTSANDSPNYAPSAWILCGSDDNSTWTELDSRSEQTFADEAEEKYYLLPNLTPYRFYRLEIKGNHGGDVTKIGEWSMATTIEIEDLMYYTSGWTTSQETPMGNRFENRHVTTDEDRTWLLDPSNEPDVKLYNQNWTLKEFPVTLYPFGEPLPADVNQHSIGNCSALAIFGAMAYVYPEFVKSLITDNGDNTYTVAMFDPQGNPVKVRVNNKFFADNNGNMTCCTGKDSKATWATVLEKALMKWQRLYKVNENVGGIGSEHVAPLFTGDGNSFAFSPGKLDSKDLTRAVKVSLAQGKIVVGGFNRADMSAPDGSGKTVTGHAWTLMWTANNSALFAMRNPWGFCSGADGSLDGVLNIFEGEMPPTIDLRIIDPGKAAEYGDGQFYPYVPPVFAPQPMRVAEHLLRSGQ